MRRGRRLNRKVVLQKNLFHKKVNNSVKKKQTTGFEYNRTPTNISTIRKFW